MAGAGPSPNSSRKKTAEEEVKDAVSCVDAFNALVWCGGEKGRGEGGGEGDHHVLRFTLKLCRLFVEALYLLRRASCCF